MKQWEYKTMACASLDELNALGAEGWELIGMLDVMVPDGEEESAEPALVFKREVRAEDSP